MASVLGKSCSGPRVLGARGVLYLFGRPESAVVARPGPACLVWRPIWLVSSPHVGVKVLYCEPYSATVV